eukprot:TRINITY_DN113071_c0_g1_i1.p1 TRINITY_DN113071_c0_g1~~TRINITY_DN113071_c0_g1_i1.p1  ORF type:complete len:316 (+),score=93.16 TRINITY_DN113071_c0_g1_i1:111-1058(+)
MSTSNPFGLSEINHYGSMQRVGGKAAGFINKKFFHPSSLRNQEKLWKAETEEARERQRQKNAEKQREEERKVEELRKQMYLAGQGRATDVLFSGNGEVPDGKLLGGKDQRKAIEEEKKRREIIKLKKLAQDCEIVKETLCSSGPKKEDPEEPSGIKVEVDCEGDAEAGEASPAEQEQRELARSCYEEDVYIHGHLSVWGSWYEMGERKWGFACCKATSRTQRCPHAVADADAEESQMEKRKRNENGAEILSKRARKRLNRELGRVAAAEEQARIEADDAAWRAAETAKAEAAQAEAAEAAAAREGADRDAEPAVS